MYIGGQRVWVGPLEKVLGVPGPYSKKFYIQ
jgi:hypothetical protein